MAPKTFHERLPLSLFGLASVSRVSSASEDRFANAAVSRARCDAGDAGLPRICWGTLSRCFEGMSSAPSRNAARDAVELSVFGRGRRRGSGPRAGSRRGGRAGHRGRGRQPPSFAAAPPAAWGAEPTRRLRRVIGVLIEVTRGPPGCGAFGGRERPLVAIVF